MYEKIKRQFVKSPQDLKSLGFPLLESDYRFNRIYSSGVFIYCAEVPQENKIKQLQSKLRLQHEHRLQHELQLQSYSDLIKHYCTQCTLPFLVYRGSGDYFDEEECRHHWGKLYMDYRWSKETWTCCGALGDAPGCATAKCHVWSGLELGDNGPYYDFLQTQPSRSFRADYGIYALDCEMVLTKWGRELARVTIVNMDGKVVYKNFVKPEAEVLDYCTRFSGIRPEDLANVTVTLAQVQRDILGFVFAETILIGHGLANDLRVLKILHYNVVDTSAIFPHPMGLPYRNSLKMLAQKYLGERIQGGEHDPAEDAITAARLIRSKLISKKL